MLQAVLRRLLPPVILVVILAFMIGCGISVPGGVTGSGKLETRDFSLSGFTGIQAGNAFSIQIDRADSFKVQVTADDNLWDSLDIIVSGSNLQLRAKSGVSVINATLKAVITLPVISSLDLSGASVAKISGFNSNSDMTFTLSGGSKANIVNIKTGNATFDMSGGSNLTGDIAINDGKFTASGGSQVNLSGSGTSVSINASGGSPLTLDQFKVQSVSASLSGGSTAKVNAQNISSADLSGGSNLYYVDSPTMGKIQTSGGSGIHQE